LIISTILLATETFNGPYGGVCFSDPYAPPHYYIEHYEKGDPLEGFSVPCGRGSKNDDYVKLELLQKGIWNAHICFRLNSGSDFSHNDDYVQNMCQILRNECRTMASVLFASESHARCRPIILIKKYRRVLFPKWKCWIIDLQNVLGGTKPKPN